MDDRALVYRGADQPDMSVINPESDVWQHIKAYSPISVRLYSRDMELSNQNVLHREVLPSQVVILSLVDNSLLTIKLHLCGSITFNGIISAPSAVRMLSWMIPTAQKQLGDPVDDLAVATVLMVVGGQLILLRPRKSANQEVKYDMQIFADRIEFCWIHLRGIGTLENSLWGYDGQGIRVWLNALAIESLLQREKDDDEPENSHLFLHHILRFLLGNRQVKEAVTFASHYKELIYFSHALEILLHTVVESEATLESESDSEDGEIAPDAVLPTVVEFLDHFDSALDVVVGCARKTELTRWKRLFSIVGNPKSLFETCLASQRLKTAGSYLLVLHNLEQLDENNDDAVRLLQSAVDGKDWQLCRELLRFLHSVDDTGAALRHALSKTNVVNFIDDDSLEVGLHASISP
ncbi:hypothetical protein C0991_009433 [Blastosporella zonata]|nr:hypothetical protein C0991_009433 [Blastosporella zonata]